MNSIDIAVSGIVVGTLLAIIAVLAWNRLSEFRRVLSVRRWITRFIYVHYGRVEDLTIHCTRDHEQPIAAGFDVTLTGMRHLLNFTYVDENNPCTFLSETRETIGLLTPKLSPAVVVKATIGKVRAVPRGILRVFCRENAVRAGRPIA